MKNYIVAVSGGVDSVVLLDMLAKGQLTVPSGSLSPSPSWRTRESRAVRLESRDTLARANGSSDSEPAALVVAHFEHGIRGKESLGDQKFVENLAKKHGLEFITTNAHLGQNVSEADARVARYDFLRREAKKHGATIVTAHHADDVVETIAINLERGTGWRGLAVLTSDVYRPLLHMTKREIVDYAESHSLEWREDSTNQTDVYLRNRLRRKLAKLDDDAKLQLLALRDTQVHLKQEIDALVTESIGDGPTIERAMLMHLDDVVADEYLRALCLRLFGVAPPRPARARMLAAIRIYAPAKLHQSSDFIDVFVERHTFTLRRRGAASRDVA